MTEKNHWDWLQEEVLFEDAPRHFSRPGPNRAMVVAVVLAMLAIGVGVLAALSGVFA